MSGVDLIKHFEGCKLNAYRDIRGVWTVGWGCTGPDIGPHSSMTQAEADAELQKRVDRIEHVLNAMLEVPVTPNQKAALVSLCYNIGLRAFEHSTLRHKLNQGDTPAAAQQFLCWDFAAGRVVPGLLSRRMDEKRVFVGEPIQNIIGVAHG